MFEQQVVNGLMLGSSYALIAVGYTLVFGVLNLLNLAHGEVFMFAGYIGLFLVVATGLPIWVAALGAMAGAGLLSLLLWLLCFRPASRREYDPSAGSGQAFAPVLSTVGFGLMLQQLATRIWGSEARPIPARIEPIDFHFGPVLVSSVQLLSLGAAVLLMVGLSVLIARTELGRRMRAISENPDVAELLGVDTRRTVVLTFLISGILAGAAGILVTLRTGSVAPLVGISIGLKGLAVMVIGGLGNFPGAVVGGLLLGVLEVMTIAYGSAAYADLVIWGALILILLLRPGGLFGVRTHVGRA